MPTISEIEAERAKILEQIENKAKQNAGDPQPASLKDWLNAAQEVVPEEAIDTVNARAQSPKLDTNNAANVDINPSSFAQAMQASVSPQANTPNNPPSNGNVNTMNNVPKNSNGFSIAALLLQISIFMIFALILYFGYRDLSLQMQNQQAESMEQINALKETLAQGGLNEESLAQMTQLDERITFLESQLTQIQEQISELYQRPDKGILLQQLENMSTDEQVALNKTLNLSPGLTEEMLDKKLKEYNQQLANQFDQRLDEKLRPILKKLNLKSQQTAVTVSQPDSSESIPEIAEPEAPKIPRMEQPLLSLVQPKPATSSDLKSKLSKPVEMPTIESPKSKVATAAIKPIEKPKTVKTYKGIAAQDIKWIKQQSPENYTLQLASMKSAADLKRLIENKNLKNTKILPQIRNGKTNYILLLDSLENRSLAKKIAGQIKKETGISPWVRKLRDVQNKVN